MEVSVITPDGVKLGNTSGVPTKKQDTPVMRRISQTDLNGILGEFLRDAMPIVEPNVFSPLNTLSILTSLARDNSCFFAVQGRAVIMAYAQKDFMKPFRTVDMKFLLLAEGGGDKDAYDLVRACKRWARDLKAEMVICPQEYTNLPIGKVKDVARAKEEVRIVVAPLKERERDE